MGQGERICCGQGQRLTLSSGHIRSPCPTAEADFSKASIRSFNMLCSQGERMHVGRVSV